MLEVKPSKNAFAMQNTIKPGIKTITAAASPSKTPLSARKPRENS